MIVPPTHVTAIPQFLLLSQSLDDLNVAIVFCKGYESTYFVVSLINAAVNYHSVFGNFFAQLCALLRSQINLCNTISFSNPILQCGILPKICPPSKISQLLFDSLLVVLLVYCKQKSFFTGKYYSERSQRCHLHWFMFHEVCNTNKGLHKHLSLSVMLILHRNKARLQLSTLLLELISLDEAGKIHVQHVLFQWTIPESGSRVAHQQHCQFKLFKYVHKWTAVGIDQLLMQS